MLLHLHLLLLLRLPKMVVRRRCDRRAHQRDCHRSETAAASTMAQQQRLLLQQQKQQQQPS
jgi:hypothetical protein